MELVRTISLASAAHDRRDDAAGLPGGHEPAFQFFQLVGLVRRKGWLMVLTGLLGAALAFAAATYMQHYSAKALVLVEPLPNSLPNQAAGGAPSSDEQTVIETHILTLLSQASLSRVLASLAPLDQDTADALNLLTLERNLKIQQELHSRVISVVFSAKDPKLAAAVANRTVELYVARQQAQKREAVAQRLAHMQERVQAIRGEIDAEPRASPGQEELARGSADQQRRLQESLILASALQRQKDIIERDDMSSSGVSILSPAVPPLRPSTGSPIMMAAPGFVAFSILGFFMTLVVERCDRTLRSSLDVERSLGVPCFGQIPQIWRPTNPRLLWQRLSRQPGGAYGEAIMALLLDHIVGADDLPKVVLVTSALAREGKTTLARALAAGAVRLDRKVLLIDLGWRAPMSKRARRQASAPLPEQVDPSSDLAEGIQMDLGLFFDRLSVDRVSKDPLATVTGRSFADVLAAARKTYALIIIDGPNLLGNAEANLLVGLADEVLLAVRWGWTRREFTRSALHNLLGAQSHRSGGADRLGVVLTRVNLRRHQRYRFGDKGEVLSRM